MICKQCSTQTDSLYNDLCWQCHSTAQAAWIEKMAVRQDPAQFNMDKLVRLMLTQHWMHEAEIIPAYMPPHPSPSTRPECKVRLGSSFLRYSNGPLQGYFWDIYGDNMHSPELALIALSNAPAPRGVDVVPTHGR